MRPAVLVLVAALVAAPPASAWLGAPPAAHAEEGVAVGSEAPDFALKDTEGNEVRLSSFRGKRNVVVAFFPQALSKLCTVQMKCYSTEWRKVDDRGAEILAISGDPVEKLREFAKATGARFPMLSDAGLAVAKLYGSFTPSPEGGYASRCVFLVDREGKVRWLKRDYTAPRTLEGTELLAQIEALRPATADPADAFAKLPSPEKEARTLVVRYVQALLAEDMTAVEKLFHREFGAKPGHTPEMIRQRRTAELDRIRKMFDTLDLKSVKYEDVLESRDSKVLAKGDHEKPGILAGFSAEALKLATDLPEGDLLVVARTKALKVGETTLLPRESWMQVRKDGGEWRIFQLSGR